MVATWDNAISRWQAGKNTFNNRSKPAPPLCPPDPKSSPQPCDRVAVGESWHARWRDCRADVDMVLDPQSQIGSVIELRDSAAKKGSGRLIPIHPDLAKALAAWRKSSGRKASGRKASGPKSSADSTYVVRSERGGQMTPLSVVVWFNRAFHKVGLKGCSSHSGRRTFITRAARLVHRAGGSIRDVQLLAGHRSIQTTQRYIDGDSDAQRRLVSLI